ncbi:MAG TPA: ABC transporter permease subunit [Dehalococcoidales bacterium]|nr:ABC transporter permease subunit [Dehalococcoidales bacterium]
MTGLVALLKKELREQLRTYKLLIVTAVFLFFGFATPLLIKYTPQLLEATGEDIIVQMPEPSAAMAIGEYAGTIVQIGVLIAVLMLMGAVARERNRGLAAMILSKPVSRGAYITAKFLATSVSFIAALVLGSTACWIYTVLLIEPASVSAFLGLNLLMALFLVFCLSVTLLCSSLFRNQLIAGGVALVVLVVQALLTQVPGFGDYMPGQLTGWGIGLLSSPQPAAWPAVAVCMVLTIACLFLSPVVLRRKEL